MRVQSAESRWGPGWNRSHIQENIQICSVFISWKLLWWMLHSHTEAIQLHTSALGMVQPRRCWNGCSVFPLHWRPHRCVNVQDRAGFLADCDHTHQLQIFSFTALTGLCASCGSYQPAPAAWQLLAGTSHSNISAAVSAVTSFCFPRVWEITAGFHITIFTQTGVKQQLVLVNEMSPCPQCLTSVWQWIMIKFSIIYGTDPCRNKLGSC